MLKISQAIIVEGKYDKIKLSGFIDTIIIDVGGFSIFKNKEKTELIKTLAETVGVIILTDSDSAGALIRNRLGSTINNGTVYHAYLPQICGKEQRKTRSSAEGILGVEGVDNSIILEALKKCGIKEHDSEQKHHIFTSVDLFELGLSGKEGSVELRKRVLKHFNLPTAISRNNMLKILSLYTDFNELQTVTNNIKEDILNGR